MASPKPAVIVRREFETTPTIVAQQLRACIIGSAFQLVRFFKSGEKANGLVKTVTSLPSGVIAGVTTAGTSAKAMFSATDINSIPNIAATSVLDAASVKVFVEDAYLTYADFYDDGNFVPGDATTGTFNSITLATTAWKGASRNTKLIQNVAVGDVVQLYTGGAADGGTATLVKTSRVTGFTAVVGADNTPAQPTVVSNFATIGSASIKNAAGTDISTIPIGGITFTLSSTGALNDDTKQVADPRKAGSTFTNYTLTVNGWNPATSTAKVAVVSSTGLDDQTGDIVCASGSTTFLTLPSGFTIASTALPTTVTTGANGTFKYTPAHTLPNAVLASATTTANGVRITANSTGILKDTTYYATCISGGSLKTGCTFRVTTNNGSDVISSDVIICATSTLDTLTVGSYGLGLTFNVITDTPTVYTTGFVKGDSIRISITAAASGLVDTLVLADAYTATTSPITRVRLSKIKTVEVPRFRNTFVANWAVVSPTDAELRRISLSTQLIVRSSNINAGLTDAYITAGKVYFEYKAYVALPREVGSVNSLSDITTRLGTVDPANELAYGVYKAWSNANGATVHFIPTLSNTLTGTRGFADALSLAKGVRNCYSIVPLSQNADVWSACVAHAQSESSPANGRYRIVWIAPEVATHNLIQDSSVGDSSALLQGDSLASTITGQWTVTTTAGLDPRFTETVQPGDYVRTNFDQDSSGAVTYVEYKIVAVVDNDTVIISSSVDPALANSRIEIFRNLSSAALATEYVKVAGGFSSERVFAVVSDRGVNGLRVGGVPVKNWNIACAFAGLRSGSRPHQPLANVELLGFDGSNDTIPAFDETDLDTLRDGGTWVVRNDQDGRIYAERQLSTSVIDLFRKEQSVTCNVDSVSFTLYDALKTLVGRINITPGTLAKVSNDITAVMNRLSNKTGSETIGAQILAFTIVSVSVPTTAQDTVTVKMTITVPLPMNIIDITLVI